MAISKIKSESGMDEVIVGDLVQHSYYLYPIYYLDDTYAYMKSGRSIRGAAGSNGAAGADGVSATHSWNGTVLTITSASGTSSADLKGDKGDTGAQGPQGPAYTLTDADKSTITAAVIEALPKYAGEVL